jgi:SAM-dependent methyltransferase
VAETYTYRDQRCPRCLSHGRHRALACYLESLLAGSRRLRVLDVGGFRVFKSFFERRGAWYIDTQLGFSPEIDVASDLTLAPFADEAFDLIVCYHVLEHIPDDRAALREMARVLRKDGRALIQVPWHERPKVTVEFGKADPLQHGHVRVYGEDLLDRISESGLQPTLIDAGEGISTEQMRRFGIAWSGDREIIVCTRKRS